MDTNRKTAIAVGVLILLAYAILGTGNPDAKWVGMLCEVVSGLAVIGIAWLMAPLLLPYGKQATFWYAALKGLEGVLMLVGGVFFLIHTPDLLAVRDSIYLVHGYIFAVPALIFYYLLYRAGLVPRWLSVWGAIAALILVAVNLLEVLNIVPGMEILYLPIVSNEAVLALWLIFKGFNRQNGLPE